MKLAPYTAFKKTKLVPIKTWTNNKEDDPPKSTWDETMWIERGEDWCGLSKPMREGKTVRIIERDVWIKLPNESEVGNENN